ncbi:NYN domain-containing protein [Roseovarius sp.]|uniref:NYN domain-containing protein n=1 Tax=Roseovarius sp. TaxID=1486281 RepID=UPI003D10AA97
MKVGVFVDGFNLYYRGLKRTKFKWLDLQKLSCELLSEDDSIEFIRYFTAAVSPRAGDAGAPERQDTYLRALRTIPNLTIHNGRFLPKTKKRPLVEDPETYVEIHDTEEKGSDVNLASHLLNDAFRNRFEAALIVSQDTDLCEPLRMVKHDLKKTVGIAWLDSSNPGKRHKKVSDFIRHANSSILGRSQFSNPVIGKGGMKILKPEGW